MMVDDLVTALKANVPLAALIGNNVYSVQLPQKSAVSTYLPAIVYHVISGNRPDTYDIGVKGLNLARVQFMVIALDYRTCRQVIEALRQGFDGFVGVVGGTRFWAMLFDTERDMYDPDALHYRIDADFRVIHKEP